MKLGIIVDSSSGLTLLEAKNRKWGFLPLVVIINDKEYRDGVDFDDQKFALMFRNAKTAGTAATPLQTVREEIAKFASKNDLVIVYPLSHQLSSQKENIELIARDFPNVFVVESVGVGHAIVRDLEELMVALSKQKNSLSVDEVKHTVSVIAAKNQGAIALQTMEWLIKGGRISPAAAKMAGILRVTPIVSLEEGRLEKLGVARGMRKAIEKLVEVVIRRGGKNAEYIIYESPGETIDLEYKKLIENKVGKKLIVKKLPNVIAIHTGLGAISLNGRGARASDEKSR